MLGLPPELMLGAIAAVSALAGGAALAVAAARARADRLAARAATAVAAWLPFVAFCALAQPTPPARWPAWSLEGGVVAAGGGPWMLLDFGDRLHASWARTETGAGIWMAAGAPPAFTATPDEAAVGAWRAFCAALAERSPDVQARVWAAAVASGAAAGRGAGRPTTQSHREITPNK